MAAINTRVLQSDLMVAALTCGHEKHYNSFVKRFSGSLEESGAVLRGYFSKNYPKSSEKELNSFVTRLANNASSVAAGANDREAYCKKADKLFKSTLDVAEKDFGEVAGQINQSKRHGIKPCSFALRISEFFNRP